MLRRPDRGSPIYQTAGANITAPLEYVNVLAFIRHGGPLSAAGHNYGATLGLRRRDLHPQAAPHQAWGRRLSIRQTIPLLRGRLCLCGHCNRR